MVVDTTLSDEYLLLLQLTDERSVGMYFNLRPSFCASPWNGCAAKLYCNLTWVKTCNFHYTCE